MITRILDSRLPLMAYHPVKVFDINYFKAIHEAGGLPVLDTEFFSHEDSREYIEKLSNAEILFGIRLSVTDSELINWIYKKAPQFLDSLIFYYTFQDELENFEPRSREIKIFIEIRDIKMSAILDSIAPDAIILKGFEAGGMISRYTGYVLMQWYLLNSDYPLFIHGGVGMHNSAGLFSAGASGVVLDSQLHLSKEAPVSTNYRKLMETMEDFDTALIEGPGGTRFRFFAKLGTAIVHDLKKMESHFALSETRDDKESLEFFKKIHDNCASMNDEKANLIQSLFYLGQDAIFAKIFATAGKSLKEIITAFFRSIREHISDVEAHDPIHEDSELAKEHSTKYPIIQGPMANISESAEFAEKIFRAGGLPFFAMGNLPEHIAEGVIENAAHTRIPYGAGLIGIEVFNKNLPVHLGLVKEKKSPFALFAGGSPFQVADLERAGTKTYLHTPSSMMLENAIQNGCTRYILEGTEAGGHVGSLGSLVLWELAVDRIERMEKNEAAGRTLIFAGGISTSAGSHFISGMTSSLSKKGVKIGIQVGSAYLFTKEIIETKCITERYQKEIISKDSTLLMGRTVGLPSRTLASPFSLKMVDREHERISEGMQLSERKRAFEKDNIGSLLIGAKGLVPDFKNDPSRYIYFNEEEVYDRGNFCVGDSLAFFYELTTIEEIHDSYFKTKNILSKNLDRLEILTRPDHEIYDEIAVIGMGCVLPDSMSPDELWENVISRKNSLREIPADRLDPNLFYSPDKYKEDKTYSKIAGIIENFRFDGTKLGLSDEHASKISRSQQLILTAAKQAVDSAGYNREKPLPLNTAVIIASCLGNELTNDLQLKYYTAEIRSEIEKLPEFIDLSDEEKNILLDTLKQGLAKDHRNEPPDTAVLNIEASRVAAVLNLEGPNYVVDAACATSFAAIDCGIRELLSGSCDAVVTGGLNTNLTPEAFIGFSRMGALSGKGSWPFDERADGFVLGEGAGVFVLKRMRDAVRDRDNILGIIKGMGGSSDGKGKAIAAPNPKGQELALRRCFENAKTDLKPEDIGYIEAHGTSTIMGDAAETETIKAVYGKAPSVGISSIKSQIGHLLGGAGAAGLVKALLALRHKTLPPNADFKKPSNPETLKDTGIFVIGEASPWRIDEGKTRKAAVSSYGFGGINYHCVIEEYTDSYSIFERNVFPDPEWDPNDDRIVVTGLGAVLPGANDVEAFWEKLLKGESAISDNPDLRFNMEAYSNDKDKDYRLPRVKAGVVKDFKFDNVKYRIPPMSAASVDRAQLFGLTAADQAITSSGLTQVLDPGNRVSVILGTISGTHYVENVLRVRLSLVHSIISGTRGIDEAKSKKIAEKIDEVFKKRLPRLSEDTTPGLLSNIVSGRIANFFGCNGANFIIDAACASSAIAIRAAILGLLSGTTDYAITGGVDTNFYPTLMMTFKRLGLLSEKDTRIFDENGTGVNLSEGAAIQILTTYKKAKKLKMPILGEIRGMEMRSNAGDNMFSPSATLFNEVIEDTHRKAGSSRDEIDHLDVFGFGHYLLDQIEHRSVRAMFRKPTAYGNIKPEFGYFKAANPAVVLTRMILMNSRRTCLPFNGFDPASSMTRTSSQIIARNENLSLNNRRRPVFCANIFGFGGNHGHIVTGALPAWMAEEKTASISLLKKDRLETSFNLMRRNGLAVLLSGQGSQYKGMLKELYATEAEIRSMMDQAEVIFKKERGHSLLAMMFDGIGGDLSSTENTQPAVFLASAAIFSELQRRGLIADAFIGHSVGEYTALFTSGMLDFETALRLVLKRSSLMKEAADTIPGEIMAVFKGSEEVESIIKDSGIKNVHIANKNSRKQTVVSGAKAEMAEFAVLLSGLGILFRKLNLSGAFHTPLFSSAAKGMSKEFEGLSFRKTIHGRVISNVTARPYPEDGEEVKNLLVSQIISPVEFINSVEHLYDSGIRNFIEIGSNKILGNLLKDMDLEGVSCIVTADQRQGERKSFDNAVSELTEKGFISAPQKKDKQASGQPSSEFQASTHLEGAAMDEEGFDDFLNENKDFIREKLLMEYRNRKRDSRLAAFDQFGFYTGSVSIAGVSVGLPGTARHVFESDNFDKLLSGQNFIEALTEPEKDKMLDKNITRLVKQSDGNARFMEITSPDEVIQLAGKLGFFDLEKEYGIAARYDITIALSIAAGIEALKDAGIPLVMNYKKTASGGRIPEGLALPLEMQANTGVILTSLFPGWDTLIDEVRDYYRERFFVKPYQEMEKVYYFLMEKLTDPEIKSKITEWFFKVWKGQKINDEKYAFKRDFPANITPLGSAHFARIIKARGPNIQMSGACASTTQAICVSEDWIRTGRCERVIIIGGEAATSRNQSPWIGSGFLALGAASTKKSIHEAAKPFDEDRNGTILGAGATSLIIERTDRIKKRGMNGQAEILGTRIGNSAFHTTGIDVKHLSEEMAGLVSQIEKRHGLKPSDYAEKTIFMSHETFTPARGGSADAEIEALRTSFGVNANKIAITNTKGYTGHTLGAAIEDAVMVKALQTGKIPPVANLKKIPENFKNLRFSTGEKGDFEYGLHLSAGFGSHFAFLFIKKTKENSAAGNPAYGEWLKRISGLDNPVLKEINKTLCIEVEARETEKTGQKEQIRPEQLTKADSKNESKSETRDLKDKIRSIIAEQTGYSEDMLGYDMDLEADLGIDTVKQVEIFGKITAGFGVEIPEGSNLRELNTITSISGFIASLLPEDSDKTEVIHEKDAEESSGVSLSKESTKNAITSIIAGQTGYSEDMLGDDLDLEADLGIDTVKQVEIFGKITAFFGVEIPEGANLRELNSISKIAGFIEGLVSSSSSTDEPMVSAIETIRPQTKEDTPIKKKDPSYRPETADAVRKVISDQTGYSQIMLTDESDLEADLGIDTLKQVDIIGQIMNTFEIDLSDETNIRDMKSIADIATFIDGYGNSEKPSTSNKAGKKSFASEMRSLIPASAVKRFYVGTRPVDNPKEMNFDIKDMTLLVSLDTMNLSSHVIPLLKGMGANIVTIGDDPSAEIRADFTSPERTASVFEKLSGLRPEISGLVHLAPLSGKSALQDRGEKDGHILALFNAVKAISSSSAKRLRLIAVPAFNSVIFPEASSKIKPDAVCSGISGFLKSLAREMPETRVKVVDFGGNIASSGLKEVASRFVKEILSEDSRVETGYINDQKYVPALYSEKAPEGKHLLEEGANILVTGGAGGITFEIVKSMIRNNKDRSALKFIITGRSDLAGIDPEIEKADQSKLLSIMKQRMPGAKPVDVKKAVEKVKRLMETRDNLDILRNLGSEIIYHAADVTDPEAVQRVADSHPEINGIIHAAGIEESQIILKKSPDSFKRVFNTKVKGFRNISKTFEKHDLKFIIGFSSVTARFGNAGQSDYTAANDMLGKLILSEKIRRPDLIVKIMDWTAWEGAGMATNETVKKVLTSLGLTFLPLEEGIRLFGAEIGHSQSGETVFTGLDHDFDPDGLMYDDESETEIAHFLDTIISENEKEAVFARCLDLEKDLFLHDHSMGNIPIFLGATGIETMAEAASRVSGKEAVLSEMTDFAIPYGIKILKKLPKDLEISASATESGAAHCLITSKMISPKGEISREHYKGTFVFKNSSPAPEFMEIPSLPGVKHEGELDQVIYHPSRLFMEGLFKTIESIDGFDGETLITSMSDTSEKQFFKGVTEPEFLTPVVLVDAMFQTGGLFNMMSTDELVLPSSIRRMVFLKMPEKFDRYFCITRKTGSTSKTDIFDLVLADSEGRVFIRIEGFEMVRIAKLDSRQSIRDRFTIAERKAS